MAYYMAKEQPGARVYIVERSGVKNKFENRLKKVIPGLVLRIFAAGAPRSCNHPSSMLN